MATFREFSMNPTYDVLPLVYSANIELTDSSTLTRLIACASISARLTTRIFAQFRASADKGMVSVTTTSSSPECLILFTAGPDKTGWVI